MARQIIFYGDYFVDFYKDLGDKVKDKVKYHSHSAGLTIRTFAGIKTGKPNNTLLPGFDGFCKVGFLLKWGNLFFVSAAQNAVISDFHETVWQYMHAETAKEFHPCQ